MRTLRKPIIRNVMKTSGLMFLFYAGAFLSANSLFAQETQVAHTDTVTTALGRAQDLRTLPFQIQKIEGNELTKVKDANFLHSLIGRTTGATLNPSSAGTGAGVRVRMRGTRSIWGNNNVLYVIDGIPFPQLSTNTLSAIYTGYGLTTDAIASLNAEDIEDVSILSGPSAAALYGSDAANGAILITTKKGKATHRPAIHVSQSTTFSKPFVMPEFQNQYYQWNTASDTGDPTWNPSDFYRTGHTIQNHVSLSAGTDINQSYFSAATQHATGLIENNLSNHYNLTFRNSTHLLDNKLHIDFGLMYMRTKEQNMLSHGDDFNPIIPVYLYPECLNFRPNQYGQITGVPWYERYDPDKDYYAQYWPYSEWQNPYWIINRNTFLNKKDRFLGNIGISYDITPWLSASARVRYDKDVIKQAQELYASTSAYLINSENGLYGENKADLHQLYSDLSLDLHHRIGAFSFNALLGGSIQKRQYDFDLLNGGLIQPNGFSADNIDDALKNSVSESFEDKRKSLFASLQIGFKDMLYVYATGRKEWNDFKYRTFYSETDGFYPSVGIAFIPTAFSAIRSDILSFTKLRFDYSETGATHQYALIEGLWQKNQNFDYEALTQGKSPVETTKSYEAGIDLGMFQNRLNLSLTLYTSTTHSVALTQQANYNQLMNATIENRGVEMSLQLKQPLGPVEWNSDLTYTLNKNKIKDFTNISSDGTETDIPSFEMITSYHPIAQEKLVKGGSIGDIYVRAFRTDSKGNLVIGSDGLPEKNNEYTYAGNAAPKYQIGWSNDFNWKGIALSFVLQGNFGGKGLSLTQAMMDQYGVSKATADARNNGGVWVGQQLIPAKQYYNYVTGLEGVGAAYIYDATNVRLAELSVGYTIPMHRWVNWIQSIKVSFVGRNLCMIYNKAPFDPMSTASMGNFMQGIDYFNLPSLRNLGFSVSMDF